MELSLERKVYGAVLGLALTGLAADRLFFSSSLTGPDSVYAGDTVSAGVTPSPAAASATRSSMAVLSEKIESFRSRLSPEREDAFVLPASVTSALKDAGLPTAPALPETPAAPPPSDLQLRSVGNVGTPDAIARVGDHLLRLGERGKSGLTLLSLEQERDDSDPMSQTFVARVEDPSGRVHTLRMAIGSGRAADHKAPKPR